MKNYKDFLNEELSPLDLEEIEFLKMVNKSGPLHRKLMNSEEISLANRLVKKDWLVKGTSSEKPHSVIYYVDLRREDYKKYNLDD